MIGFLNVGFKATSDEVKYTDYEFKLMWFCGWFKWSRIYLTLENKIRLVSREPRFGVGVIYPQGLEPLLQILHDCLNNTDWTTRKAAADALNALALHSRNLMTGKTGPTITALEYNGMVLQLNNLYNVNGRYFSNSAVDSQPIDGIVDIPLAQTDEGITECELLKWFVNENVVMRLNEKKVNLVMAKHKTEEKVRVLRVEQKMNLIMAKQKTVLCYKAMV
ncbi:2-oxoacid dehydrogenases acyltransferase family protein [Artemisia annua]|uniref:2-oxoacid dehydrogenases acyltransferase family protein n=1 Tax=Artemisia annua TaxID=35608 RepID=A0A2U1PKJ3_ARTAN|nr:2-oxoacid dehydrogenases acyltransferase family protein [Artemisia annua]